MIDYAKAIRELTKAQRRAFDLLCIQEQPGAAKRTRVGKRKLDSDSVACSMKHVRDEIADGYGVDDEDPRIEWEYAQTTGADYAVHVVISPRRKRRKGEA